MTRQQIIILIVLGVLNVVFLCCAGALVFSMMSTPAIAPTPTSEPTATSTPTLIPTATPIPATATLVFQPPTPRPTTQAYAAILTALDKSQQANVYRMQMDMSAKGVASGTGTSSTQEMTLISMTGEMNRNDSHIMMKGMVAILFTGDANATFEMMSVGGKEYVKGPMPLFGAKENKWYILPNAQSTQSQSTSPEAFYNSFMNGDIDFYSFTKTRTEDLDRQKCDVYSADQAQALRAFASLSPELNLTSAQIDQLQKMQGKAEFAFWICADGFVHQIRMGLEGKDASGKTGGFNMSVHLYDFNSPINIIPPANPLTATNPFLVSTPSPTPKK